MKELLDRVDAVVIINHGTWIDKLFFYFTQLRSGVYENSAVIVTADSKLVVTSKLEFETAEKELKDAEIIKYESYKEFLSVLATQLQKQNAQKIGLNFQGLSHHVYLQLTNLLNAKPKSYNFIDVSEDLSTARMIKTREEIEKIRKACQITTQVANEIPSYEHDDEKTVAAFIEFNLRRKGASSIAFPTISAIGENAADPHYVTGERKPKAGEFLLNDFGGSYARYNADVTRTFIFEKADAKAQEMYETVLQAQLEAMDEIYAGAVAKDIDAIARKIIDKKYPGRFIHNLGHGLGLDVHDGGLLGRESELILEEGMVFTVEPGVYLRNYGGVRIEDDIVITKNGYELLTPAKKDELITIPLK